MTTPAGRNDNSDQRSVKFELTLELPMKLKSPHILLASSNTRKMLENIRHILDQKACDTIQDEIDKNVKALFDLGLEHFNFAKQTPSQYWRQRISRFYYGAYNVRRARKLLKAVNIAQMSVIIKRFMICQTIYLTTQHTSAALLI
jgi:hypothetical protein